MIDRKELEAVLQLAETDRYLQSIYIDDPSTNLLIEAAKAYLAAPPDQPLADLINQLGETRAILHRNAMQPQLPQQDRELLQMMFNTVSAAMTVIQRAMVQGKL